LGHTEGHLQQFSGRGEKGSEKSLT